MKKGCLMCLVTAVSINYFTVFMPLEAIATENTTTNSAITIATNSAIAIADSNLDAAIRQTLNKNEGTFTQEELQKITSLDASQRQITDLTGIENLSNLTELYLGNNEITDISSLKSLTSLNILSLEKNNIEDVSQISSLKLLNKLYLSDNLVTDFTSLKDLYSNLIDKDFSIEVINENSYTKFPDPGLDYAVREILNRPKGFLFNDSFKNITSLTAVGYGITNLEGIQNLKNLSYIVLIGNNIVNLDQLKKLTELKYLSLSNNGIEDISALASMNNLMYIELYDNKIKDISSLKSLNNLVYLSLWNNQIEDISSIGELKELQILDLYNNKIKDITLIKNLTNLLKLNLSKNLVTDYSILKNMINPEVGAKIISDETKISASMGSGITERDFEIPGVPSFYAIEFNTKFTERTVANDKQFKVTFNQIVDETIYSFADKVYVSYDEYGEHKVTGISLTAKKTNVDYVKINAPAEGYKPGEYYLIISKDIKSQDGKTISKPYRMKFIVQ